MNDKNKKYIYIAVILLCIGVTVYFMFFFSGGGGDSAAIDAINQPLNNTPRTVTAAGVDVAKLEFNAPAVFPAQNKFSTAILQSGTVTGLTPFERVTITGEEVKKDDPFAGF